MKPQSAGDLSRAGVSGRGLVPRAVALLRPFSTVDGTTARAVGSRDCGQLGWTADLHCPGGDTSYTLSEDGAASTDYASAGEHNGAVYYNYIAPAATN
ncbi:hypothetical protein NDU88_001128 [Pleurodeles waltl]|uniref:Uncharacterized protein n=1 Tax=Pleurodeles waltl TaxID=8319 RepID=A0AAV7LYL9_PLEWA|nr:hypothetical protein NDU88_001128 [Pleurodeles waltl]